MKPTLGRIVHVIGDFHPYIKVRYPNRWEAAIVTAVGTESFEVYRFTKCQVVGYPDRESNGEYRQVLKFKDENDLWRWPPFVGL